MKRTVWKFGLALALALLGSLVELPGSMTLPLFHPSEAQAIIGRPATPLSYAGVARRTTVRRASYVNLGGPVNRVGVR